MKEFDKNYKLLDEMYQDDYYPAFLVDKVKDELQKVIDLLESGETDIEVVQEAGKRKRTSRTILAVEGVRPPVFHSNDIKGLPVLVVLKPVHPESFFRQQLRKLFFKCCSCAFIAHFYLQNTKV